MSSLQEINQKLLKVNEQYEKVFNDNQYKSPLLTMKYLSLLPQQRTIYGFAENGSNETKKTNKKLILTLVNSYFKNFLNSHIFISLSKSINYEHFEDTLSEKWKNFKWFTFVYCTLLHHVNNYYEVEYERSSQSGIRVDIDNQKNLLPIPVIALNLFKKIILSQFEDKIQHIVLKSIKDYRLNTKHKSQNLKNILIWACGLAEFGRIKIFPLRGATFYKPQKSSPASNIKMNNITQDFFRQKILNKILQETQSYYADEYFNRIIALNPFDQAKTVRSILEKEYQFCESFLLTKRQRQLYMDKVQGPLFNNVDIRLRAPGSLKTLIQNYRYNSEDGYADIVVYFDLIRSVSLTNQKRTQQLLKIYELIISQVISQQGKQINQKISKRRCIRLKLDQQRSLEKFTDIFILLNVITSTDSFLLYHQESMAKRIVQPLHEPKLEYELLMLKKLSQRMGVMTVSSHMSMIKDMENSQEMTEKYNNRLPFSSFKWSLKIFNPSFWPQTINRQKLSIELPNQLLHHAKAIEDLYHGQNQYRYLNWKLQKGTSLFEGRFQSKKVRFQSQNSYLMILLLISEQPQNKIIYGNLKHLVKSQKNHQKIDNLSKNDPLSMLLYVLIENKLIIRRNVENKFAPFSQSEEIEVNKSYTVPETINKGQQVVIIRPSQQMNKNLQQSSVEKSKIIKDREKLIEAVLVKVMKHSHATKDNSVTFTQLYQTIRDHHILGGFNFSQGVVKQRLQQLIAREYCIRDEDDRKVYHYVA